MSKCALAAFLTILVSATAIVPVAHAVDPEFSLAGGATRVGFDDNAFDDEWGVWVQPSFTFAPISDLPQFRLGGGLNLALVSLDIDLPFDDGDANLFLITPELLLSWRQPLGDRFYLEPGVGVGAVIGVLDAFGTETDVGYSVRPFLRAGYDAARWSAGVEVAYRFGQLDLGGGSSDLDNLNIGAFVSFELD